MSKAKKVLGDPMGQAVAEGVVVSDPSRQVVPLPGVVVGSELIATAEPQPRNAQSNEGASAEGVKPTKVGSADAVQYVFHPLGAHDEIGSLAIRYGSSIDGIMRANGLLTRDLDLLPVSCILRIPRTHEKPCAKIEPPTVDDESVASRRKMEERDRLLRTVVRDFATNHGCPRDEATFYLEEHAYDVHAAERALADDRKWERSGTGKDAKRVFKMAKKQPLDRR